MKKFILIIYVLIPLILASFGIYESTWSVAEKFGAEAFLTGVVFSFTSIGLL